jgi:hypothetical protein
MSDFKGHLLGGTIVSIVYIALLVALHAGLVFSLFNIAAMLLVVLISPLLPDIDLGDSKIVQWFTGAGLLSIAIGIALLLLKMNGYLALLLGGEGLAGITFVVSQRAHHRGWIHTVQFCLAWGIAVFLITKINIWIGLLAFLGSWSHLWLDHTPFKISGHQHDEFFLGNRGQGNQGNYNQEIYRGMNK